MGTRSRHVKWNHGCSESNDEALQTNENEIGPESGNIVYVQVRLNSILFLLVSVIGRIFPATSAKLATWTEKTGTLRG